MMIHSMPIHTLDVRSASEGEYRALNDFENRLQAEELPDDPPMPLAEAVQRWRHIPAFVELFHWVIWQPERSAIMAVASAELLQLDTNQHVMECHIAVLPEFRRQGIARALLVPLVELAQRAQRRLLIGFTNERVPA
ncbi:MAG TPA: GNAT family N-acetyltransferase, partial [Caldilineaceae bacterium]|nr:GNAT family N-acetyltransferase [Caldilineaceae bacterium]